MNRQGDVVIIGGGVIGLFTAYYAAKKGARVLVLEKGRVPCGSSYGNAGLIVPDHVEPLPAPGIQWKGFTHHFNPEGAFRIGFQPSLSFLKWLYRFNTFCNEKHYVKSIHLFKALNRETAALYREFHEAASGFFEYDPGGTLQLYLKEKNFNDALKDAEALKKLGVDYHRLSGAEIRKLDPSVTKEIAGGFYEKNGGRVNPGALLLWLKKEIEKSGGEIIEETEVLDFNVLKNAGAGKKIAGILTTKGEFKGDQVVTAAGAWTGEIMKFLGINTPVLGLKGYSMTYESGEENDVYEKPVYPSLLYDAYVAVNPMKDQLRLTGFLELSGLNHAVNKKRLKTIRISTKRYYKKMNLSKLKEIWRGFRPGTPDGLPIMGKCSGFSNLYTAGGHTSKGVTLGPVTGKNMAELLSGRSVEPFITAFSPDRFK